MTLFGHVLVGLVRSPNRTVNMDTILIVLTTIAGLKLAKYLWSIIWEWA